MFQVIVSPAIAATTSVRQVDPATLRFQTASGPDGAAEGQESNGFLVDSRDKNQQERGENTLISDGFGHASAWKLRQPCDRRPRVTTAAGELAQGQDSSTALKRPFRARPPKHLQTLAFTTSSVPEAMPHRLRRSPRLVPDRITASRERDTTRLLIYQHPITPRLLSGPNRLPLPASLFPGSQLTCNFFLKCTHTRARARSHARTHFPGL